MVDVLFVVTASIVHKSWYEMRMMKVIGIVFLSIALVSCGVPHPGVIKQVPEAEIEVINSQHEPMKEYNLFVYKCSIKGELLDEIFVFDGIGKSKYRVIEKNKIGWVRGTSGYTDTFVSYDPIPFWSLCVEKNGFEHVLKKHFYRDVNIFKLKRSSIGESLCPRDKDGCDIWVKKGDRSIFQQAID